jgi:hypothetical protein
MSQSPKLLGLHKLLRKWPSTDDAERQERRTARALKLLDDAQLQRTIEEGTDNSGVVRSTDIAHSNVSFAHLSPADQRSFSTWFPLCSCSFACCCL